MAALESTLNAEAEDSVVVKETALTTTEDEDTVGPLEAWGETKEPEKEEKKLHQCVFDTNRKLGLHLKRCLLYTSPSPRDRTRSRMPSSA